MNDLFGKKQPLAPLAEALRPRSIDEVVGQQHLLGPGKSLRVIATLPVQTWLTRVPASVGKIARSSFISHSAASSSGIGCSAARPPSTMRVPSGDGR